MTHTCFLYATKLRLVAKSAVVGSISNHQHWKAQRRHQEDVFKSIAISV